MTPGSDEADRLIGAAEAAADAAGAIIRTYFRSRLSADAKSDQSPVTVADRAAEQAMRGVLAEHFPEHGVLGEEAGLDRGAARWRWVLDPIDGTRAFITGRPIFGALIALLDRGRPVLGIIDQPITGERWIGFAGRPTVFRGPFGGVPGVRDCASLAEAELSCTSPELVQPYQAAWDRLAGRVLRITWGGDCYAYGLLALGHIDAIVEADLKVWDWAALLPVVEGAGGAMADWSGQELNLQSDGRVIAVGDARLLPEIISALGGH